MKDICHWASHRYVGGRGGAFFGEAMRQKPNESVFAMARYCLLRGFAIANDIYIEPLTPPSGANPEQSR
jgi:hypothetical protein